MRYLVLACLAACAPAPAPRPTPAPAASSSEGFVVGNLVSSPVPIDSAFKPPKRAGLEPVVIRDVIRAKNPAFQRCYEDGLRRIPALQGRVVVYLFIERTGAVREARDQGSALPDTDVVKCVVREFASLSFPPNDSGVTTIVYPISFAPLPHHPAVEHQGHRRQATASTRATSQPALTS